MVVEDVRMVCPGRDLRRSRNQRTPTLLALLLLSLLLLAMLVSSVVAVPVVPALLLVLPVRVPGLLLLTLERLLALTLVGLLSPGLLRVKYSPTGNGWGSDGVPPAKSRNMS